MTCKHLGEWSSKNVIPERESQAAEGKIFFQPSPRGRSEEDLDFEEVLDRTKAEDFRGIAVGLRSRFCPRIYPRTTALQSSDFA